MEEKTNTHHALAAAGVDGRDASVLEWSTLCNATSRSFHCHMPATASDPRRENDGRVSSIARARCFQLRRHIGGQIRHLRSPLRDGYHSSPRASDHSGVLQAAERVALRAGVETNALVASPLLPSFTHRPVLHSVRSSAIRPPIAPGSADLANQRAGVLQPVEQIAKIGVEAGGTFILTRWQALAKCPIRRAQDRAATALHQRHKIHGPRRWSMFVRCALRHRRSSLLIVADPREAPACSTETCPALSGLAKSAAGDEQPGGWDHRPRGCLSTRRAEAELLRFQARS